MPEKEEAVVKEVQEETEDCSDIDRLLVSHANKR